MDAKWVLNDKEHVSRRKKETVPYFSDLRYVNSFFCRVKIAGELNKLVYPKFVGKTAKSRYLPCHVCLSVYLSVRPSSHGTTWLPLEGFS
jgi:hypothetical protein